MVRESEGKIVPDALKRRPKLKDQDEFYMRVFRELTKSREMGESIEHIPVSEFRNYCDLWGITGLEEKERLSLYLSRLDDAFVSYMVEQRSKEMEKLKK